MLKKTKNQKYNRYIMLKKGIQIGISSFNSKVKVK